VISVFDLFKIGIGPSSSHTIGPMRAAAEFAAALPGGVARIKVELFGSLAWTGKGHGTDRAVILGLAGELPETVDPDEADAIIVGVSEGVLKLAGGRELLSPPAEFISAAFPPPPGNQTTLGLPRLMVAALF